MPPKSHVRPYTCCRCHCRGLRAGRGRHGWQLYLGVSLQGRIWHHHRSSSLPLVPGKHQQLAWHSTRTHTPLPAPMPGGVITIEAGLYASKRTCQHYLKSRLAAALHGCPLGGHMACCDITVPQLHLCRSLSPILPSLLHRLQVGTCHNARCLSPGAVQLQTQFPVTPLQPAPHPDLTFVLFAGGHILRRRHV